MPNPLLEENLPSDDTNKPAGEEPAKFATPMATPEGDDDAKPKAPAEPKAAPTSTEDVAQLRQAVDGINSYLGNLHTFLTTKFGAEGATKVMNEQGIATDGEGRPKTLSLEDIQENPSDVLGKFFDTKMSPIVEEYRRDRIVQSYEAIKAAKKDWAKFEPRIAQLMRNASAEDLAKPGALEVLYNLARAEKIDDLLKEAYENGRKSVADGDDRVLDPSLRPGPTSDKESVRLSAAEREMARKFGLSDKEYVDWKAA